MLRKDDIRFVKESLAPHVAPVLSAYLNVNPAEPTNAGRAWQAHLKNALKNLDIPRDLAKQVIDKLEMERPVGRTPGAKVLRASGGLVVEDQRELEAYCPGQTAQEVNLRDVLPDLAAAHGARPEFVQGKAAARLHHEFGGLAGLSRW